MTVTVAESVWLGVPVGPLDGDAAAVCVGVGVTGDVGVVPGLSLCVPAAEEAVDVAVCEGGCVEGCRLVVLDWVTVCDCARAAEGVAV